MIDFKNAAIRHYNDAELLYSNNRLANADHLYGLSAECYLKAEIIRMNPSFVDASSNWINRSEHGKHVNILWNQFQNYIQGRTTALTFINSENNDFSDWSVNDRYENDVSNPKFNQNIVDKHRLAVKRIYSALIGATP
jgi:hypothetical protein